MWSRLILFLDNEDVYAYDSQVIHTLFTINGKEENGELLRIGRVFFAIQSPKSTYLYTKKNGNLLLNPKPVTSSEKRMIKVAIDIVKGTSVPSMTLIPFHIKDTIYHIQ